MPTDGALSQGRPARVGTGGATARLAIFDLDRTLGPGSSLAVMARALVDAGLVARRRLAGAAVAQARFARHGATDAQVDHVRERVLRMVAGLEHERLRRLAEAVAEELVAEVGPVARSLVELHRRAGDVVVVLSASPQELVEVVTDGLGVHLGIGTRGEVVDGRLTGRLDGPFCHGPGKLARLRDVLGTVDLRTAWAYADSGSDLALLQSCGHPVAVNPDRRLRTVAAARGWPVIRF